MCYSCLGLDWENRWISTFDSDSAERPRLVQITPVPRWDSPNAEAFEKPYVHVFHGLASFTINTIIIKRDQRHIDNYLLSDRICWGGGEGL